MNKKDFNEQNELIKRNLWKEAYVATVQSGQGESVALSAARTAVAEFNKFFKEN